MANLLAPELDIDDSRDRLQHPDVHRFYHNVSLDTDIPFRDHNLNLPVIGDLFYCDRSALDHAATEAGIK
ncbi:unnamed protein product [Timema podura]|uniref:Uncharacterized protein n=1 Tax=Timema podura TaxID=61482 RepID=A0ABN7NL58_TIMPD|nr:unnamed protein product [Timema podura]